MRTFRWIVIVVFCMLSISVQGMAGVKIFESANLFSQMQEGDRAAILMVHFGSAYEDTRKAAIDAINDKVKAHFPKIEVRESYTSRIVIKKLKEQGIEKLNPTEALLKLKLDGYTHVLIQSTSVINGVEMEALREEVALLEPFFKELRVSQSLLFYTDDYKPVIEIMTTGNNDKKTAYLWMAHGTYDSSAAQYSMLDHMLKKEGFSNHIVGCVAGYPFYEQVLQELKQLRVKKVRLMPFTIVAGAHAKKEIGTDLKQRLEKDGFQVDVVLKGLGEIPAIQDRIVEIIEFNAQNRRIDILEKKKMYSRTGEVLKK